MELEDEQGQRRAQRWTRLRSQPAAQSVHCFISAAGDAGFAGPDTYLVGIGINCNRTSFPRELDGLATSLCLHSGSFVDRDALLLDLAIRLDRMIYDLTEGATDNLLAEFRRRLGLLGRRVTVAAQGEHSGVLTDLDFASLQLDGSRRIDLGLVTRLAAV